MSLPTTAAATITIDAAPERVYDLIADITRMGEWSPECISCEWTDEPNQVGSTFRGRNRRGIARWSTVARVLAADRPRRFTFATLHRDAIATRWSYEITGDQTTMLTETFTSVSTPLLIGLAERWIIRDRQAQLECGMELTLARIKVAAEMKSTQ